MTVPVRQSATVPLEEVERGARLLLADGDRTVADRWRRPHGLAIPLVCSVLIVASSVAATPPLRALGVGVPDARLRLSAAYTALAPYCDVMDVLTLLSVRQHAALLVTTLACYALLRWRARRWTAWTRHSGPLSELVRAAALIGGIAAIYAVGALLPRPMAAIELSDPNSVAIDFHSHTDASWDGRRGFDAERNREWHRTSGFDVSYVSDHATIAGAIDGMERNPARAGEGTVILPAVEVRCSGQHVVLLGATTRDTSADCDSSALPAATSQRAKLADERVSVLTIPGALSAGREFPTVQGIEIADGAPRGLDQMSTDDRLLRHIADSAGLARISGSNNHGWGRTAAAWSVMSIEGWRGMSPETLDVAIRRALQHSPQSAVRVIERRRALPALAPLGIAATAPVVAWTMLTALSAHERLAWIVWLWSGWVIVMATRMAHVRSRRPALLARALPVTR